MDGWSTGGGWGRLRVVRAFLQGVGEALEKLGGDRWTIPAIDANIDARTPRRARVVPAAWVREALWHPTDPLACEKQERLGDIDVSLVRPVLAVWPVPQVPPAELPGEDPNRWGGAIQFWGAPGLWGSSGPGARFIGASLTAGFGFSYRLESILPARPNAAVFEISAGVSGHLAARVEGGELRDRLFWFGELRFPIVSAVFWHVWACTPLHVPDWQSRLNLIPMGARVLFGTGDDGVFGVRGLDFEGPAYVIPWGIETRPASRTSALPWEVRTRFGASFARANDFEGAGFFIGLEMVGGVSTPLAK